MSNTYSDTAHLLTLFLLVLLVVVLVLVLLAQFCRVVPIKSKESFFVDVGWNNLNVTERETSLS